jgi:hypothetical protein
MTVKRVLAKRKSAVFQIAPPCSVNVTEEVVVNPGTGRKRKYFIK